MAYVKNAWYAAGFDADFNDETVLARTLLGEPLVFFRSDTGAVVALEDRCPHRGVPLSMGTCKEGRLRCLYHALEFGADGVCTRNPHIAANPGYLKVKRIPTVTRYGVVWIWHGDESHADPSSIPDYSCFVDERYAVIRGELKVDADYRLIIDNLLDLSHAEYLHARTVGTPGSAGSVKTSMTTDAGGLTVHRKVFDLPPSKAFARHWTRTPRIDQYADMTWRAPSNLLLDLGIVPPGEDKAEGFHFPSAHLLTPETERSTHYFYAVARDFGTADGQMSEAVQRLFVQAFDGEDRPVIEAIQRRVDESEGRFQPANFTVGDGASKRVRTILDGLTSAAVE